MTKKELQVLYWKKEKEFEKAKNKRTILSILLFSVVYLFVFWDSDASSIESVGSVLAALFVGGLHFYLHTLIFLHLFKKSEEEKAHLQYLEKQINESTESI